MDKPPLLFVNDGLIMEVLLHVVLVIEGLLHGRVDLWTEILRPPFMLVHDPQLLDVGLYPFPISIRVI